MVNGLEAERPCVTSHYSPHSVEL